MPDHLRGRQDVEGHGEGTALLKVTHPQLRASVLPLGISVVLYENKVKFTFYRKDEILILSIKIHFYQQYTYQQDVIELDTIYIR